MKKEEQNDGARERGLSLEAGLLAAAAAGYFLFGPQGKENREGVKQWMLDAKAEIVSRAAELKTVGEVEFGEIVDTVLEKYQSVKEVSEEELAHMAGELKHNWKLVALKIATGDVERARDLIEETVSDEVDRIREKAAEEIAPDDE